MSVQCYITRKNVRNLSFCLKEQELTFSVYHQNASCISLMLNHETKQKQQQLHRRILKIF